MAYQQIFSPGKDFSWIVSPFLKRLPKTPYDEPLSLEYPIAYLSQCKWQWYNWMHHCAKGMYKITIQDDDPVVNVLIKLAKGEGRIKPASLLAPKIEELEDDAFLNMIKEAVEKEKESE